ncbi:cardioacceleratory peptide receptor-like isoform X2 [Parasteatoda tepidariorum]|uniref:cardioacceleratory peptide receptor-like isoform X2 n=1 Tax=Parasteatoda tepidariorum TaxID=114398 RepID=UPI00077FCA9D|nr:cardioacceleratory peptide receptor-like isoform X2 [Parasteatoda tepidariorum]
MDNFLDATFEYTSTDNTTGDFNFSSANDTVYDDGYQFYYFYQTEQLTFLWVLFIMIVAGNSAVLIALALSKNRKSRMNFFIMHLAIADLTVGVINVLTDIIWRTTVAFYADNIACKLIKYLQALVTYSSTYVLVALSVDRYDAIAHPMNFSNSWRKARILVASAWALSAVFSIPSAFLSSKEEVKGMSQCWIDLQPWQWQVYITLVAASLFFLPALIIAACYTVIVYTIWTKSRIMSYPKLSKSSSIVADSKKSCVNKNKSNSMESEADRKRASSRGIIPRAKIKTVKMTLVIVFVFILCWSPYFVYDLLQVYGKIPDSQTSIAVSTFIQSLAPLNSAANPLIYCLFSTHICRNFRLPFCNWIAEKLCICFPSMQRPFTNGHSRASEYTTMTETLSTTHRNSTFHPMTNMTTKGVRQPFLKQGSSKDDSRKEVAFNDLVVTNSSRNSNV